GAGEMRSRTTDPATGRSPEEQLRAGLHTYLTYARDHAATYRAVLRGGIGTDPEVAAIAEEFRQAVMERVLRGLQLDRPAPHTRLAIRGWIGAVEAASLDWIDHGTPPLSDVVELLAAALGAMLAHRGA